MQAASICYGKETTVVALDDDDDEDDDEGVVGQNSRDENEDLKKTVVIPDQVQAVSMEVQQDETDCRGEFSGLPDMLIEFSTY